MLFGLSIRSMNTIFSPMIMGPVSRQELLHRHGGKIGSYAFLNDGLLPEQHRARPIQEVLVRPRGLRNRQTHDV